MVQTLDALLETCFEENECHAHEIRSLWLVTRSRSTENHRLACLTTREELAIAASGTYAQETLRIINLDAKIYEIETAARRVLMTCIITVCFNEVGGPGVMQQRT